MNVKIEGEREPNSVPAWPIPQPEQPPQTTWPFPSRVPEPNERPVEKYDYTYDLIEDKFIKAPF